MRTAAQLLRIGGRTKGDMEMNYELELVFRSGKKPGITSDRKPVLGFRRMGYYDQIKRPK